MGRFRGHKEGSSLSHRDTIKNDKEIKQLGVQIENKNQLENNMKN